MKAPSAGLADGARVTILAGNPTEEELAALVAALDAARRADAASSPGARPAWLRAFRTEAVGGGPVASPADL